jgi:hypothetical protein
VNKQISITKIAADGSTTIKRLRINQKTTAVLGALWWTGVERLAANIDGIDKD